MRKTVFMALCALTIPGVLGSLIANAHEDQGPSKMKPAPVIVRFNTHAMSANDFQVRRSKDRSLEAEIKKKGIDLAFTEWMQRDHPFMFASECIKQVGEIANDFKSTPYMLDFDKLVEKRSDLRLQAAKYGHDVAFAEWLRTEHPDIYLRHFGITPSTNDRK